MTQAPTPGPLSGDDELIERGLRSIRTYDAVRSLRDALTATTARLTGYDWNADPDAITKQQGDAFAAADRVFADLDAAVASHPDIDLPECEVCNGTGKIEEAARTEGANQHSACIRACDECDGCGFAPDESLAPTAPAEREATTYERLTNYPDYISDADGLGRIRSSLLEVKDWHDLPGPIVNCNSLARLLDTIEMQRAQIATLRPKTSGETRFGDETAEQIVKRWAAWINDASEDMEKPEWGGKTRNDVLNERDFLIRCLSARPLALGGQQDVKWLVSVGSGPYGPKPFDNEAEAIAYFEEEMAVPSYMGPGHRRHGSVTKVTTITEKVR